MSFVVDSVVLVVELLVVVRAVTVLVVVDSVVLVVELFVADGTVIQLLLLIL